MTIGYVGYEDPIPDMPDTRHTRLWRDAVPVTNLKAVVGKLNPACRRALEAAAGLCMSRTNYNIEVEHWLLKLVEPTDGDLPRLFKHYGVDTAKLTRELTRTLDGLR